MLKVLIPEAEKLFTFNFKERKYLFRNNRLGSVAIERLVRDLTETEVAIMKERLPHLYEQAEEVIEEEKGEDTTVKNEQKASGDTETLN
jgi:hypothetical protein